MTAEIVCVGTELLLGNTINTNAAYLAERCAYLGLSCYYQTVVGDNPGRLKELLKTAFERSDIVITSGGLGPTEDDLTKETVSEVMGLELVMDETSKNHIIEFFKKRNRKITDNNWKQAMIPKGSIALENANGTAPGIIINKDGKTAVLLPGPPGELIPMFKNQVEPYLIQGEEHVLYSEMVKISGIGESEAESMILDLIHSTNPTVATYAKVGEVHIRVTAFSDNEESSRALVRPVSDELVKRFGDHVFTIDPDVTFEEAIINMLAEKKMTVTTAESCTGGMIASRLINVAGASAVYNEGFITYSNEAKMKHLGVKESTLSEYGAVSKETAYEMAEGVCKRTGSDAGIAVTGIAGPGGGTKEKPVGLVYIGCSVRGKTITKECHFSGNRMKIRESTCAAALRTLRECVLKCE